ncbi:alpha/beta-hydrolase [Flagelloscypha sp. PMI_526]|nr:alpha/beta-hydrolase [Flagelloscypha sp. PMI_526]
MVTIGFFISPFLVATMFKRLALVIAAAFAIQGADARYLRKTDFHQKRAESVKRFGYSNNLASVLERRTPSPKNITFSNPKASKFYVDGKTIPEVDWDVGPSWSGLLPISNKTGETRKLFFWFFPPGPDGSLDDLIFWTNGGPGCSSMEGFLQENGPITWSWGTAKPTQNEYSWTNLSSVLWVEQPVGTGFSQGEPNIKDENDLAEQLVGFLNQFLEVFGELNGKKLYLTGESYAGYYVPYIANYIYENPKALPGLDLQGIWIADPSLSYDLVQEEIPAYDFMIANEAQFALSEAEKAKFKKQAKDCGYLGYIDKYVKYPPQEIKDGCDIWSDIFEATLEVNPAFNIYRISDVYPILWDVLGFPGSFPDEQTHPLYFDRADVKAAIHAPNTTWLECSDVDVFPNGDTSPPSALSVLPNVIEKSKRTVIIHGLADYVLIALGSRIVLQNMTWHGQQGFHNAPVADSFHVDGMGSQGTVQTERGLSYFEVKLSGHMIPQFVPKAGLLSMQYLMGFRDTDTD